ncbi:triose-phosphate isomerase family protein [Acididesulfobacillus acetoxydans]|uniref:triose-phosphate isomerase family protein n=1 Tax=Acididesulfobacillus acetoxydans TaxID=1561005 RepID=UPI001F0E001B|nr:triose-phosphate isomerase family protein [Acididesulfobacillus acetoxydans]
MYFGDVGTYLAMLVPKKYLEAMAVIEIFVNLKRFDVPKKLGGVCSVRNPKEWISWIMAESVGQGLGKLKDVELIFFLPEGLILNAYDKLFSYPPETAKTIKIGCQGVFREDIRQGGNFGAFTTNRPATAARNMGCTWVLVGHSEEMKDKLDIMARYDPETVYDEGKNRKAKEAVYSIINQEVLCALEAGMDVLLCVGETAEERGEGSLPEQKARVKQVLRGQLEAELKEVFTERTGRRVVIAYEPIWAIGPGKIPAGPDDIAFAAACIKEVVQELMGVETDIVYGGGLKEDNARAIAKVKAIGGGLVALTQFAGNIGFYPNDLSRIIGRYVESRR